MTFQDLNLLPNIQHALTDEGYTNPTPIQEQAIPIILEGNDIVGCAQTGTGKTAAFAIPIIHNLHRMVGSTQKRKVIRALIVTPTRELAIQIGESFDTYGRYTNIRQLTIFGGVSQVPQVDQLKKGIDVLIVTPGRLLDLHKQGFIDLDHLHTLVLDEADQMLDMGFINDVKKIIKLTPDNRQTLLFSATMPIAIRELADSFLTKPKYVSVTPISSTAETVEQRIYFVGKEDKRKLLYHLIRNEHLNNLLVFTRTKHGADNVVKALKKNGVNAEAIHGDLRQAARNQVMNKFRTGNCSILVATDVAARGIDVSGVDAVFNYDLPMDLEYYVHRIGRTGRAGKLGKAFALVSGRDRSKLRDLERYTKSPIPQGKIPTFQDLQDVRQQRFIDQIKENISEEGNEAYELIVDQLKTEGFYTHHILSALIRMQLGTASRPMMSDAELSDERRGDRGSDRRSPMGGRPERGGRFGERESRFGGRERSSSEPRGRRSNGNGAAGSGEPGMVRLFLNLGRKDSVSPNHIVGAIASETKIPGKLIGQIDMYDKFSFVEVPERDVEKVIRGMKGKTINSREASLEVAK